MLSKADSVPNHPSSPADFQFCDKYQKANLPGYYPSHQLGLEPRSAAIQHPQATRYRVHSMFEQQRLIVLRALHQMDGRIFMIVIFRLEAFRSLTSNTEHMLRLLTLPILCTLQVPEKHMCDTGIIGDRKNGMDFLGQSYRALCCFTHDLNTKVFCFGRRFEYHASTASLLQHHFTKSIAEKRSPFTFTCQFYTTQYDCAQSSKIWPKPTRTYHILWLSKNGRLSVQIWPSTPPTNKASWSSGLLRQFQSLAQPAYELTWLAI